MENAAQRRCGICFGAFKEVAGWVSLWTGLEMVYSASVQGVATDGHRGNFQPYHSCRSVALEISGCVPYLTEGRADNLHLMLGGGRLVGFFIPSK